MAVSSRAEFDGLDEGEFRIPRRAWLIALSSSGLAGLLMLLVPGPSYEGCFTHKGCHVSPLVPFYAGTSALVLGSMLSTWIGGVPRQWVTGWSAATAGIAALLLVALPLAIRTSSAPDWWRVSMLAGALSFGVFWVVQIPSGLLASFLPPPFRRRMAEPAVLPDDRPLWLCEITSTLAAIERGDTTMLTAAETQLVAQLVFALEADPLAPRCVLQHAARVRSLLSRADEAGMDARGALVSELRFAAAGDVADDPYRVA